ncbi:hypothetical protein ACOSP7_027186 [Xanthoceras sorbifolium]
MCMNNLIASHVSSLISLIFFFQLVVKAFVNNVIIKSDLSLSFAIPASAASAPVALAFFARSTLAPTGAGIGLAAPAGVGPVVATIAASVVVVPVMVGPAVAHPASVSIFPADVAGFFFLTVILKWLPSQLGHFKLNVDAALNSADGCFRVGFVVRNDLGSLVVVKGFFFFFFRDWCWLMLLKLGLSLRVCGWLKSSICFL